MRLGRSLLLGTKTKASLRYGNEVNPMNAKAPRLIILFIFNGLDIV